MSRAWRPYGSCRPDRLCDAPEIQRETHEIKQRKVLTNKLQYAILLVTELLITNVGLVP